MSYGDPAKPSTGRAQVPGAGGSGYGDEGHEPYRASSGRRDEPYRDERHADSRYDGAGVPLGGVGVGGSSGRASVGRASVSGPSGGDESMTGRASVPGPGGAAASGRATVGRASVRASVPVGVAGAGGYGGARGFSGPGGFSGPAGPGGPPGRDDVIETGQPGRRPNKMTSANLRAKKRRQRNWIIAGFATFILLTGVVVVGGTYSFDSVELPSQLNLPESTTIYYADGKTPMAKIGNENRTLIPYDQMPLDVQHAVVAAEDNSFYSNNGIDFKGIVRAAWNNFTGGERQGASTITQQYARNMAELKGISYSRKLREAIIAMKLSQRYRKPDIMWFYLNTVYFGRGAYGIEAAAQVYFGKSAKDLTVEEGMVLAGLIKDPEGTDGTGSPFDPTRHKDSALDRWTYVRDGMVKLKFLPPEKAAALKYPVNIKPFDAKDPNLGAQWGLDRPSGLIVHHVLDELSRAKDAKGNAVFPDLKTGGYKIITTVDATMQHAAETVADLSNKASPMYGQPPNLQAALVAVEPRTGRVKAYYGGPNGAGSDYAGWYQDPVLDTGEPTGFGYHPPGSSFKIYTLAAGLINGYSVNSYWDGSSPKEFPASGRTKGSPQGPVSNASAADCQGGKEHCMLWEATEKSLNTPFFGLSEQLTAAKVLEVARAAGIRYMWASVDGKPARMDLTQFKSMREVSPKYFSTEAGIGQYPVTVLDHANGVATIAARGQAAPEHFVMKVLKGAATVYAEQIKLTQIPGYTPQMADDENWALQKVVKNNALEGGRPSAAKTGTWQYRSSNVDNAHAWIVGFTAPDPAQHLSGLAAAVWMGNKSEEKPIKNKYGGPIYGATGPGPIWRAFMNLAMKGSKITRFPEPKFVGDASLGNASSPEPTKPTGPDGKPCLIPALCPTPTGGGGGSPNPSRSRRG